MFSLYELALKTGVDVENKSKFSLNELLFFEFELFWELLYDINLFLLLLLYVTY